MTDPQEYVGKIVLVERANPGKDYSSYYDGEKIVYQATPNQLFTIPISGGGHGGISAYSLGSGFTGTQVPLHGAQRYNVIKVDDIPDWIWGALDDVEAEIKEVLGGRRKAQWVESIYHHAQTNIHRLRDLRAQQTQPAPMPAPRRRKATKAEQAEEETRWESEIRLTGTAPTAQEAVKIRAFVTRASNWIERKIQAGDY